MKIHDDAWEKFVLYAKCVMYGSPDYNKVTQARKAKGNTVFGNLDADILDVFIFWREEIQAGQPYSAAYMKKLTPEYLAEEEKNDSESKRLSR